jgi:P27 family predicted phage terminase small subunit
MSQPAKTPELHALHGTVPQGNRYKVVESYLDGGRPKYPKGLSPAGKKIFKTLCGLLEERAALTKGDVEAIRLYCKLYERHQRATEHLDAEGEICPYERLDSHGQRFTQYKTNLWLKVATDAERQMVFILVQLGLTPRSKDSLKPTRPAADDTILPGSVDDYLRKNVVPINRPVVIEAEAMDAGGQTEEEPDDSTS